MFEKVARFVTKRYKLIVIAWIAALLFAVPFAPQLFDVLQYEETRMAPTNIESEVAQRYINDHFGNVSSQGSTIIVLTDSNMLGNDTKNAVYQIDDGIFDAVRQDANSIVVKVDSLYSAGEHYLTSFLMGMSSSYATVAEQTNLTAFAIFGLPTQFQSLYNNTNQTAFMIYGIPDIYNQTWTTLYHGSLNVDIADNQTYASVGAMLQSLESSMDPSMQQMVGAWYQVFTEAWNKTSNIPGVQINPVLRAQLAQSNAFEPFLSGIEAFVPANQTDFLSLVNSSFSFTTYNNFHALSAFSYSLLVQNIDSNLGNATQDEKDVVSTYFDAFYSSWNASASAPSETAFRGMVANAVGTVAASLPTEEGQFLQAVYAGLGLSAWNNSSAINAFAANVITAAPNVEPWVMDQLLSLGPNPSLTQISNMAGEIVQNSSVTEFPVPFPQELIDSFVSPDNTTMIISLTYTNETGGAADGQAFVGPVREVVRNVVQGTNIYARVANA